MVKVFFELDLTVQLGILPQLFKISLSRFLVMDLCNVNF